MSFFVHTTSISLGECSAKAANTVEFGLSQDVRHGMMLAFMVVPTTDSNSNCNHPQTVKIIDSKKNLFEISNCFFKTVLKIYFWLPTKSFFCHLDVGFSLPRIIGR